MSWEVHHLHYYEAALAEKYNGNTKKLGEIRTVVPEHTGKPPAT